MLKSGAANRRLKLSEDEALSEVFLLGELSLVFFSVFSIFDSVVDSDSDFSLLVVFPA